MMEEATIGFILDDEDFKCCTIQLQSFYRKHQLGNKLEPSLTDITINAV